ncbi:cupin domain-containing protein [Noviherbaspirillum sp. CPCC 100848]|uniref:Cupin domain-containing protein n=1 Tax=Noviherbaspirillum album TaxID=3080276 RepID=A0ABU6JH30_9BURK|nr:cupin domain-containing protein [Noviherbaspirillum sp. CPCC 100848]MEC4722502.1 cupin domain-containing protein [Noviherbaspirillum sp. CPCC 100848]
MHVITQSKPAATGFPGIEHVTLAGAAEGLRAMSIWQQSVAPGAATPPHRHDCEEVVMCEAGTGELHIDGRVERFTAEQIVVIPANAQHQILSVGKEPLRFVAVFSVSPVQAYFPDGTPIALPWRT